VVRITATAADVIERQRHEHSIPESYGIRVFGTGGAGRSGLALKFAARPAEDDEISEQHGTRLYVSREVAGVLADVDIDAVTDHADHGEHRPRLVLRSTKAPPPAT
jgi:Fe-S cluster assembly iron-binding protein IscA